MPTTPRTAARGGRTSVVALLAGLACLSLAQRGHAQAEAAWTLVARVDPPSRTLGLEACAATAHATVDFTGATDTQRADARPRRSAGTFSRTATGWRAQGWQAGECAHFEIDLEQAARRPARRVAVDDRYRLVEPRQWLWLPDSLGTRSTLAFLMPRGNGASVPWLRTDDTGSRPTYALGADPLDGPALTAFGAFTERRLVRPGGVLRIAVLAAQGSALATRLDQWIDGVAEVALEANGRLPLRDAQILIVPIAGSRAATPWGEVQRGGGSALHLYPGAEASPATLRADWTATHEIAHLFHPYLGTRGRWLGEGLASYYQNVLRARSGWLDEATAISLLRAGFARGRRETERTQPPLSLVAASRDMHATRGFMRVYWAGAAYWLEVDAALRRQHGTSLDAVLAHYAACCLRGGDVATPERMIATLDRLSGTREFTTRFAAAAHARTFPEASRLDALLDDPVLRAALFARAP